MDVHAGVVADPEHGRPFATARTQTLAAEPAAAAVSDTGVTFRAERFHLFYGARPVLKDVTLDVRSRQILAVIGPSGCGKSSLLRSFNRMNDRIVGLRVEGRIVFDGMDIYGPRVDVVALRRRVGMVFQHPVPFPMTVYENVAYGPRLHGLVRRPAELDALVEHGLRGAGLWDEVKDALRRPAAELSGGQQQRLSIARVLAISPEVVLLDEPTSAIDPIGAARIEDTVQRLAERYTVVLVTHNIRQAARIAHRTAFLLAGELVEEGPTDRLFRQPADPRTEAYVTGRFGPRGCSASC